MRNILLSSVLGVSFAALAACSDPATSDTTSGPSASSATSSTSGTGGQTASSSGSGQTTSDTTGQTTSSASGQTTTASSTQTTLSTAGSGGAASGAGGSGGTGGSGGAGGSGSSKDASADSPSPIFDAAIFGDASRPAKPSAGCMKATAAPPSGNNLMISTGGMMGVYNLKLPAGYNGTKPMPLGFGFHGANNGTCGPTGGECQGFANLPAVTVYMKSFGTNWEGATLNQNVQFWQDVFALMKSDYCIDENHVFIAGVSSGGQFINILSCRFGDQLWQTTAVSAANNNPGNCKGTPAALIIHGVTDMVGMAGQSTALMYAQRNGCSNMPPAALAATYTDLRAKFAAMPRVEEYKCLDWDACTLSPVRICLHSQMTYGGLTHGWPRFGGQLISEFQAPLP
jgi:polyhydroxybutyrate depolymerase